MRIRKIALFILCSTLAFGEDIDSLSRRISNIRTKISLEINENKYDSLLLLKDSAFSIAKKVRINPFTSFEMASIHLLAGRWDFKSLGI